MHISSAVRVLWWNFANQLTGTVSKYRDLFAAIQRYAVNVGECILAINEVSKPNQLESRLYDNNNLNLTSNER